MYLSLDLDEPFRCVLRSQIHFEKTNHSLHRKSFAFLVSSLRCNHSLIRLDFVLKIRVMKSIKANVITASSFHTHTQKIKVRFWWQRRLNYVIIYYFRQNKIPYAWPLKNYNADLYFILPDMITSYMYPSCLFWRQKEVYPLFVIKFLSLLNGWARVCHVTNYLRLNVAGR